MAHRILVASKIPDSRAEVRKRKIDEVQKRYERDKAELDRLQGRKY